MSVEAQVFLTQILPAGAISGALLFALWRWRDASWPAAVAVAAGFVAGYVLMTKSAPELWPADSTKLLAHFALLALIVHLLRDWRRLPPAAWLFLRGSVAVLVPYLIARTLVQAPWETTQGHFLWFGGMGGALFVAWSLLEWRGTRLKGAAVPIAVIVAATGGSLTLVKAHNASLGQMAAVVAAVTGPAVLMGLLRRDSQLGSGVAAVAGLLLPALWCAGYFFGDVFPPGSVILLTLAPLLAMRNWWMSGLLSAVPTAIAYYLAHTANPPSIYEF